MPEAAMAATALNKQAGNYLREARESLSLSQADFATKIGGELSLPISQTALSNYESGRRQVPMAVGLAVMRLSGLPIREVPLALHRRLRLMEEMMRQHGWSIPTEAAEPPDEEPQTLQ